MSLLNAEKFQKILLELSSDINNHCCDSSAFIGEINGNPVRVTIMSKSEAEDEHDYNHINPKYDCFGNKEYDSMGIPASCGKPLCSSTQHHPLCKLHGA